jgi:hypothetical protein
VTLERFPFDTDPQTPRPRLGGAGAGYAPDMTAPDHTAPSDNTTLVDVLEGYTEAGFASSFVAEEGGVVHCDTCGSDLESSRVVMRSLRRLEGASDPDDMMAVVALECGVCGASGTMVLGYGPAASAADGDVLRSLQDRRDEGDLPADSPPSETPD